MERSILIIYTGGTIGMKQDPVDFTLKPFNFGQILSEVPEIRKFVCRVDTYSFSPLIDSSDAQPEFWIDLARLIKKEYTNYDGFVVLHGTDTMSFTASALSFMLENLEKGQQIADAGFRLAMQSETWANRAKVLHDYMQRA